MGNFGLAILVDVTLTCATHNNFIMQSTRFTVQ